MPEVRDQIKYPIRCQQYGRQQEDEGPRPNLPPLLHQARRLPLLRGRVGTPQRSDHRLPGRHDLRAEERRGPQRLVHDRDQHRRLEISSRTRSAPTSAKPECANWSPA